MEGLQVEVALIQGASRGIGLSLVEQLLARGSRVFATCREPARADALTSLAAADERLRVVRLDVEDELSIAAAAADVAASSERLDLLVNVAGLLHGTFQGGSIAPEKKLDQVDPAALSRVFAVNAVGPLLVAKHFARFLLHGERAVLANVSARVGSIGDNHLGGWYAYRASKAAQNMFTRNLSIELGRRAPRLVVVALHPGTVDTALSAPFSGRVPAEKLFSTERAAGQLLSVIDGLTPEQTGRFFAWDGSEIPW